MADRTFDQMGELAKLVEKAADFGREVLRENKALKKTLRALEREVKTLRLAADPPGNGEATHPEEGETDLRDEVSSLTDENKDLADHCVRLETENDNLLNFYVASHELHSTLKTREVLSTIAEIVINLIGADRFGIYLAGEGGESLTLAVAEGMELSDLPEISLERDEIGRSLASQSIFVAEEIDCNKTELIAGVPLAAGGRLLGAIVVYGLLEQKNEGFGHLDHGLFGLLAQHAGTSLMAADLYSESERKRETFESATRLLLGT